MVCPAFERPQARRWIAGPSAIGSVKGMPISMTSAPAAAGLRIASEVSWSGSPAITKVASAARFSSARQRAKRASMRAVMGAGASMRESNRKAPIALPLPAHRLPVQRW